MKFTKNLLAGAIAASLIAVVPAHADIELGEGVSVTGFVDMSFVSTNVDGGDDTNEFTIDQVETDFIYSGSDGVSAQVDIEYSTDENGDSNTFIEQAFITKKIGDNLTLKGGRFLSYSGWETEEPTGLFQYSGTGYAPTFYGYYQQGVSAYYDTDVIDVMFSVVNDAFSPTETDNENPAIEVGIAVTPAEGLTAKLFYIDDDQTSLVNFWTSYEVSALTFAVEYNIGESVVSDLGYDDADGYMLMANYAFDKYGITVRYHDWTEEVGGSTTVESSAITIAPSYSAGDNLLFVAELRLDETNDVDSTSVALEALFTF